MSNSIKTLGEAWKVWEANGLPHPGPSQYAFPVAEALAKLQREKEQLALVIDSNNFPDTAAEILSEKEFEIEQLQAEVERLEAEAEEKRQMIKNQGELLERTCAKRDEYKAECEALQDDIERLESEREEARAELDRFRLYLNANSVDEHKTEVDKIAAEITAEIKTEINEVEQLRAEVDRLQSLLSAVAKAVLKADTEANGPMLRSVAEILDGSARCLNTNTDTDLIREVWMRFTAWVRERSKGISEVDVKAIVEQVTGKETDDVHTL